MGGRTPTIKTQLTGLAVVQVIVLVIAAFWLLAGLSPMTECLSGMKGTREIMRTVVSIQKALASMESGIREFQRDVKSSNLDQFRMGSQQARAGLTQLKNIFSGQPEVEKRVQEAENLLLKWQQDLERVTKSTRTPATDSGSGAQDSSSVSLSPDSGTYGALRVLLRGLLESQSALVEKESDLLAAGLSETRLRMYIGIPVFAGLLILMAALLGVHIARPLSAAAALAEDVKRGELSQTADVKGFDEALRLGESLNGMRESLADYNHQILEGVEVLTDSVTRIASTASQLFAGASQTASAVTETTAIVNEMERTATVVHDTARRVAGHSEHSDEIANSGTQATSDTLEKMTLIKEKMGIVRTAVVELDDNTKYVADIISAVQDITDQSHLLAVNASIEAARAGEHGKGFAVVAIEIKSLADQSKKATEKVTKILQDIRKSVGSVVMATEEGGKAVLGGVRQSEAAGQSIERLATSIAEFSDAAGIIASSSGQQFARVGRVAAAMRNVEQAMNHSVEGTNQLEQEAKTLEQLALSLRGLVSQRRTEH